jgi:Ca-activated chloride channel family protein
MKTSARLPFATLPFDRPVRTHLVVELAAPPVAWQQQRPPVCVIPVIDVSGSMQGQKLHRARQSIMKLVDHLGPTDRCGVVAFSTDVYEVHPPVETTQAAKDRLKLAVGDLEAMANTNLAGGMLRGLELASQVQVPEGTLVRVILFTDGHANHGVATSGEPLLRLLDAHRGRATLSAFGYGEDADQELLAELARRGGGNYAFVAGPDDAMSAFARELGGLLSTYARGIELRIEPLGGARVLSVLSDVDATTEAGVTSIRVDDILGEETRHLVLELELPAVPSPGEAPVATVSGSYATVGGGSQQRTERFEAAVVVGRVEPGAAQARPDPDLDVIIAQAQLLRAQLQAEAQARAGDFAGAALRLFQMGDDLRSRGHGGISLACARMASQMEDRASFEGSSSYRQSMRSGLKRGASSSLHPDAAVHLSSIGKTTRTRAQDVMREAFEAKPEEPARAPRPAGRRGDRSKEAGGGASRRRSRRW